MAVVMYRQDYRKSRFPKTVFAASPRIKDPPVCRRVPGGLSILPRQGIRRRSGAKNKSRAMFLVIQSRPRVENSKIISKKICCNIFSINDRSSKGDDAW